MAKSDGQLFTLTGAAEVKHSTYPTVAKAVESGKLPVAGQAISAKGKVIKLISKGDLDAWTPRARTSADAKIERAAKEAGVDIETARRLYVALRAKGK